MKKHCKNGPIIQNVSPGDLLKQAFLDNAAVTPS